MSGLGAAGAALAAVLATGLGEDDGARQAAARGAGGPSAVVERRTLVTRESVEGTLGYGGERSVVNRLVPRTTTGDEGSEATGASSGSSDTAAGGGRAGGAASPAGASSAAGSEDAGGSGEGSGAGTLTALARQGSLVRRGGVLYRVDGEPVLLLYGSTPAYRDLASGDSGDDVLQLERNLAELGRSPGVVDGDFTYDTAAAVAGWQDELGLEQTGVVELGRVVFLPGPRRIGAHVASVGDLLSNGAEVMGTASDRRRVTVALDVDKQSLVRRGDRVTVLLPSGRTVRGRIARVSSVAREKDTGSDATADDAPATDPELVVDVTIVLAAKRDLSRLDQAPVSVGIADETRKAVLAVPVTALLARTGGGYGVAVVEGARRRVVAVDPGLFADGLVEVSGRGVRAGMRVEVAAR